MFFYEVYEKYYVLNGNLGKVEVCLGFEFMIISDCIIIMCLIFIL